MYIPDIRGRVEEGAEQHGRRLDDLERAEENARHRRAISFRSRPRRWLWLVAAVIVILVVLFVIFLVGGVPSSDMLPVDGA